MLSLELVAGPERAPLLAEHRLTEAALFGPFTYYGVIPRGLVPLAAAAPAVKWQNAAPILEDLLNGRVSGDQGDAGIGLDEWLAAARASGVLSLRASAQVAQATVLELTDSTGPLGWAELCARLGSPELASTVPSAAALWLVKEGHTSSVWQVRWRVCDHDLVACLNVARDREAARELLDSAALLRTWHGKCPDRVVDIVASLEGIYQTTQGEVATTVIVSSWIDGLEVHVPAQADRPAKLAAAAWFVNEREEASAFVARQRIFGRWLEDGGYATWRDLERLLSGLAERTSDGGWVLPDFRINDGDLVWTDRGTVVLVGACAVPFVVRVGDAAPEYELAQWNQEAWHRLAVALTIANELGRG
jgi:hypothetical protein